MSSLSFYCTAAMMLLLPLLPFYIYTIIMFVLLLVTHTYTHSPHTSKPLCSVRYKSSFDYVIEYRSHILEIKKLSIMNIIVLFHYNVIQNIHNWHCTHFLLVHYSRDFGINSFYKFKRLSTDKTLKIVPSIYPTPFSLCLLKLPYIPIVMNLIILKILSYSA